MYKFKEFFANLAILELLSWKSKLDFFLFIWFFILILIKFSYNYNEN
ncbi:HYPOTHETICAL PROTEIN MCJ_003140 [Mesomycoplasma conjunctivae]|uniref:Uncharacterized protein n=1 Tax=Mesomycoplasma conjunctivae (strain ATCC 25834 / NCTC 10147 / HRC/581) TaxID=572263 RepID=C5J6B3_MESCH|nr:HYPOTHETICAL PROTEIN MCJ_003140 [Mesomycoplasma conjunctivae]